MRSTTRWVCSGLLGVAGLSNAQSASAYCPAYTCQEITAEMVALNPDLEVKTCRTKDGCIVEGQPLHFDSPCLSFGVSAANTGSIDLTPDEFNDLVSDAFTIWANADCGGGEHPGFDVQSVGVVDSEGQVLCETLLDENVNVWSLASSWSGPGRAKASLGVTPSDYNTANGEVFNVDVELNLVKILTEHDPADWHTVLHSIAVHEAGHFLGLAHSTDTEAVMYESYSNVDLLHRELTADDVAGICALYPPNSQLKCSAASYSEAGLSQAACDEATQRAAAETQTQSDGPSCSVVTTGSRSESPHASAWLSWILALGYAARRFRLRGHVDLRDRCAPGVQL